MVRNKAVWQLIGPDEWDFGPLIRGMVRGPQGCIYFDEDIDSERGGWVWLIPGGPRGLAPNRQEAARLVEVALVQMSDTASADLTLDGLRQTTDLK